MQLVFSQTCTPMTLLILPKVMHHSKPACCKLAASQWWQSCWRPLAKHCMIWASERDYDKCHGNCSQTHWNLWCLLHVSIGLSERGILHVDFDSLGQCSLQQNETEWCSHMAAIGICTSWLADWLALLSIQDQSSCSSSCRLG